MRGFNSIACFQIHFLIPSVMNRRIIFAMAFNAMGLMVVFSLLHLQPSKQTGNFEGNGIDLSVSHLSSLPHSVKKSKFPSLGSSERQDTNAYNFNLFAVMPTINHGNYNETSKQQLIGEIAGPVSSSIVFNFSPFVDNNIRAMFSNAVLRERWFELHPFQVTCLPVHSANEELLCALRVWLHLDRYHGKELSDIKNRFQDSSIYVMKLDHQFRFVRGSGRLLGIPAPVQDIAFNGPEDPRLFALNGSIFINFIMAHSFDNVNFPLRRQFLWNFDDSVMHNVEVNRFSLNEWEKNWTPWIINNTLHFVYQFTPVFRVLRCGLIGPPTRAADCSFIVGQPQYTALSSTSGMLLRGGTPIVVYQYPNYHIAITHSVQGYSSGRLYAAQIVLINSANMQVILVSSPIFIDLEKMRSIENLGGPTIKLPFIYARSVIVENPDTLLMAIGVNDNVCSLVRLRGVSALLNEAIEHDKRGKPVKLSEKFQREVYNQMNDWLRNKNLAEIEGRFGAARS